MALLLTPEQELKILDTFHDFTTKERKKVKGGKDSAGQSEEVVDDNKLKFMRNYIYDFLTNKYPELLRDEYLITNGDRGTAGIPTLLESLTPKSGGGFAVNKFSQLENSIVEYWETDPVKSPLIEVVGPREFKTFDEIIAGWTENPEINSPLWRKYRLNKDTNRILEISRGSKSIDSYSESDRNKIGSFILNYLFQKTQGDIRCTFDADAGVVSKIFYDFDQIKNVIFPQTIADSATTSFGKMRFNDYIVPTTSVMESAIYSKDKYELSLNAKGFSQTNPYGFFMRIKRTKAPGVGFVDIPFGITQKEGPSVNYLIDILQRAAAAAGNTNFGTIAKKTTILDLGKYLEKATFKNVFRDEVRANENGLLLDIKRGGDHEAATATEDVRKRLYPFFFFASIDLLSALESRRRKNPTIWHHGERLILYRFPGAVSKEAEKASAILNIKDQIDDAILSIDLMIRIRAVIIAELTSLLAKATIGTTGVVDVYTSNITPDILTFQGQCERALIYLLRKRMEYLVAEIQEKQGKVDAALAAAVAAMFPAAPATVFDTFLNAEKAKLTTYKSVPNDNSRWVFASGVVRLKSPNASSPGPGIDVGSEIKSISQTFQEYIGNINRAFELETPIGTTTNEVGVDIEKKYKVDTNIIVPTTTIIDEVSNPAFYYDAYPFFSLYRALLEVVKICQLAFTSGYYVYNEEEEKYLINKRTSENSLFAQLKVIKLVAQNILDQMSDPDGNPIFPVIPGNKLFQENLTIHDLYTITVTGTTAAPVKDLSFPIITSLYSASPVNDLSLASPDRGGAQQGGAAPLGVAAVAESDPQSYYDRQDLLFAISSKAAAFMESAYSTAYPQYAVLASIEEIVYYIQDDGIRIRNNIDGDLLSMIQNTFLSTREFLTLYTITDARIEARVGGYMNAIQRNIPLIQAKIKELEEQEFITTAGNIPITGRARISDDDYESAIVTYVNRFNTDLALQTYFGDVRESFIQFKFLLLDPCGCFDKTPSIYDFFQILHGDEEFREAAKQLKEELQTEWETGLFEIKTSKAYTTIEYNKQTSNRRDINTDEFITFILSLFIKDGGGLDTATSLFPKLKIPVVGGEGAAAFTARQKTINDFSTFLYPGYTNNIDVSILFFFTLLENLMNPLKRKSFFIENVPNNPLYFNTQDRYEERLWSKLTPLAAAIYTSIHKTKKIEFVSAFFSGGSRKYPKQTRRAKRVSKRHTRRHR